MFFFQEIKNLEGCPNLDTLNLSHNYIKEIKNCDSEVLPLLNTLNISHNSLHHAESIISIKNCLYLTVLDISYNKIDDIIIVKTLAEMPNLKVLYMMGNPVVRMIPNYRKTMIVECVRNVK